MNRKGLIIAVIVLAQFCCTSLWFASNGVMSNLVDYLLLNEKAVGFLTSSVQFGFITGTLVFSILAIADRFSPSKVFFVCALVGAFFNVMMIWGGNNLWSLMAFRFLTGFSLAGIYPVGMKIASDYFDKGLGLSLSFLVGALVVGTAFPHLLKSTVGFRFWRPVVVSTSIIAVFGGLLMLILVPDGPHRVAARGFRVHGIFAIFKSPSFRSAAFGYFGHMWELYTFWAFVPFMIGYYNRSNMTTQLNVSLWSFLIIAIGGLSCIASGYLSVKFGTKRIAFLMLLLSCLCCLVSPVIFSLSNPYVFLVFLLFWGGVVIADSPLFSTLVAQNAKQNTKGTALTIVNCIGFSVTIISIISLTALQDYWDGKFLFMVLAIGPLLGLIALIKGSRKTD
jgi:MFS family permease